MYFVFPNVEKSSVTPIRIGPPGALSSELNYGLAVRMGLDRIGGLYTAIFRVPPKDNLDRHYCAEPLPAQVIGHSAQLAALLALIHATFPLGSVCPGLRADEEIWATGAVVEEHGQVLLGEAHPIKDKLAEFTRLARSNGQARYFLLPRLSVDGIDRIDLPDLPRIDVAEFLARCRDSVNRYSRERAFVLLEPGDLTPIAHFLAGRSSAGGSTYAGLFNDTTDRVLKSHDPPAHQSRSSAASALRESLPRVSWIHPSALLWSLSVCLLLVWLLPNANGPSSTTRSGWVLPGIAVGLVLVGIFLSRRRQALRRSRLLRPEAFNLQPTHGHVIGREEETRVLLDAIREHRLVWLVGESGVGKSTLLEASIIPELVRQNRHWFPVWLKALGADWQNGPIEALREAFERSLSPRDCSDLGIGERIHLDEITGVLLRFREKTGRIPVLIFDQFDDYVFAHRNHFFQPDGVIKAETLTLLHPFWHAVAAGLRANIDSLHCVFASRLDAVHVLDAFRFIEQKSFPLSQLQPGFTKFLLDRLAKDAVSNPDYGFTSLRSLVARDLEARGAVLPIQMRLAFVGLGRLEELTIESYQRRDGLIGLEILAVDFWIRSAAVQAGLEVSAIGRILLAMVDESHQKTIHVSVADLSALMHESHRNTLPSILEVLEVGEVVRRTVDPACPEVVLWRLDHDYLCRAVIAINRRDQRWEQRLSTASMAFRQASNFSARWEALLTPQTQLQLFWQRLRGRVKFADRRAFVILSMVRWFANGWIAAFLMAGAVVAVAQRRLEAVNATAVAAVRLASEVDRGAGVLVSESSLAALRAIAQADYPVRRQVLTDVFRQPSTMEHFLRVHDVLIDATTALDPHQRDRLAEDVLTPHCFSDRARDSLHLGTCVVMAQDLGDRSPSFSSLVRALLLRPIESRVNTGDFAHAVQMALRSAGASVPEDELSASLLVAREGLLSDDQTVRVHATCWLEGVAHRLGAQQADDLARTIIRSDGVLGNRSLLLELGAHASPEVAIGSLEAFFQFTSAESEQPVTEVLPLARALYSNFTPEVRRRLRDRWLSHLVAPIPAVDTAVRVLGDDLTFSEITRLARLLHAWSQNGLRANNTQGRLEFYISNRITQRLIAMSSEDPMACRAVADAVPAQSGLDVSDIELSLFDCVSRFPNDGLVVDWLIRQLDAGRVTPSYVSAMSGQRFGNSWRSTEAYARLRAWVRAHLPREGEETVFSGMVAQAVEGELGCPDGRHSPVMTFERWTFPFSGMSCYAAGPGCATWEFNLDQVRRILPLQFQVAVPGEVPYEHIACALPALNADGLGQLVESQFAAIQPTQPASWSSLNVRNTLSFQAYCEGAGQVGWSIIRRELGPRLSYRHPMSSLELEYAVCIRSLLSGDDLVALGDRLTRTLAASYSRPNALVMPTSLGGYWGQKIGHLTQGLSTTQGRALVGGITRHLGDRDFPSRLAAMELLRFCVIALAPGDARQAALDSLWRHALEARSGDAAAALVSLRLSVGTIDASRWSAVLNSASTLQSIVGNLGFDSSGIRPVWTYEVVRLLADVPPDLRTRMLHALLNIMRSDRRVPDCAGLISLVDSSNVRDALSMLSMVGCPHNRRTALAGRIRSLADTGIPRNRRLCEGTATTGGTPHAALVGLFSMNDFAVDLAEVERTPLIAECLPFVDWWSFLRWADSRYSRSWVQDATTSSYSH